jgi:hypothetical protein
MLLMVQTVFARVLAKCRDLHIGGSIANESMCWPVLNGTVGLGVKIYDPYTSMQGWGMHLKVFSNLGILLESF